MKVYLHADDFGLTKKITDDILECIDAGVINSVSIMVNGYAYDYAAEQLLIRKAKNINLVLHLNLDQGRALSGLNVPLLTDSSGYFNRRFEKLLLLNFFSLPSKRNRLREMVKREVSMQIDKALILFQDLNKPLKIDSERCSHFVPVVFDSLMTLSDKYPISVVRFFDIPFSSLLLRFGQTVMTLGFVKHILLQGLCFTFSYRQKAARHGIDSPDFSYSVVHSSKIDKWLVEHFVRDAQKSGAESIEIIFHPFHPADHEFQFWENNNLYRRYFMYKNTGAEKIDLLKHKDYYLSILK